MRSVLLTIHTMVWLIAPVGCLHRVLVLVIHSLFIHLASR
eukprot:SAG11_NODE_27137_length_336_cov_0.873418_1_plen_39_part_10